MKLNKIFGTIAVAAAVLLAASCEKAQPVSSIGGFEISSSYVALAQEGGSAKIDITKSDFDWEIDTTGTSTWLTVSPVSAAAGAQTINFTAIENNAGEKKAELKMTLKGSSYTKLITIAQAGKAAAAATIDDVMKADNGASFVVTATVTSVANKHYGNFYLKDSSTNKELYIYGILDKKGNEITSSTSYDVLDPSTSSNAWDIAVGDVVTLAGSKKTYDGTVEFVNAEIQKVVKSLLDVAPEEITVAKEGGLVDFVVKYSGDGLEVNPQAEWISLAGINVGADSTIVSLKISENTSDPRSGKVNIKSAITGQASEAIVTITQNGVAGTEAVPFTVAQAIEFCAPLKAATTENYYIKGIVSKVYYQFSTYNGTATFWISDDGTFEGSEDGKTTTDKTKNFECYSVYYLENKSWAEGNSGISVGDEVVICGQLTNWSGLAETNSKNAYVYSINSVKTETGNGVGGQNYPFNVAGAIAYCTALGTGNTSPNDLYVKGKVSKIYSQFSAKYGTAIFWLSDDGTFEGSADGKTTTDKTKNFECYSVYWYNSASWTEGCGVVAEGDEVVIKGKITNYSNLAETSSKKACIYSINGKTE